MKINFSLKLRSTREEENTAGTIADGVTDTVIVKSSGSADYGALGLEIKRQNWTDEKGLSVGIKNVRLSPESARELANVLMMAADMVETEEIENEEAAQEAFGED